MNYSGSPDYEVLRAIESGAAPYYILCYQNTAFMKDDKNLNKYYGVDYSNWYDEILTTYAKLNDELKLLQQHEIVHHQTVIAERTPEAKERLLNYETLKNELIAKFSEQLYSEVNAAVDSLAGDPSNYGKGVMVKVDVDSLYNQFKTILVKYSDLLEADVVVRDGKTITAINDAIIEIALQYANEYPGSGENSLVLNYTEFKKDGIAVSNYREYSSYKYTNDSILVDGDKYDVTDYTVDNGNVVMVTYKKGDDVVKFVLNYNIYAVDVRLDDGTVVTIDHYDYHRIDKD